MPPRVQFSREQILKAAMEIAITGGLHSLTVRKIASNLGCSVAPIYVNFKNTEELLIALNDEIRKIVWDYSTRPYTSMGFFNIGIGQLLFSRDYSTLYLEMITEDHVCFDMEEETQIEMVSIMMKDSHLEGLNQNQCISLLNQMALFTGGLSLAIAKGSRSITLDRAISIMEETAYQLVHALRSDFSFEKTLSIDL